MFQNEVGTVIFFSLYFFVIGKIVAEVILKI